MRSHAGSLTCSRVVLCVVCGLAAPAWSIDSSSSSASRMPPASSSAADRLLDFDLPAQPLAAALGRYGSVTRQSVMFIDALVAGRTSAPVRGRYTPLAALNALLAGTGLVADDVSGHQGAFVLRQAVDGAASASAARAGLDRGYDGLVQARVWEALCADARTAPGRYRSILQVQVTPSGRIHQANLVSSTGDGGRDAAILATLAQLQMDRSPPPGLVQPLTLVVLPHAVLPGPSCRRSVH